MKSLRLKLSHLANKKVPLLSLLAVGLLGMALGVFAASITVTQTIFHGEIGTYHNNTGVITVTDKGLGVVANGGSASTSATFPSSATNTNVNNLLTAGHWFDQIVFNNTATDSLAHTATVTVNSGTSGATGGTPLVTTTFTLTGGGATLGTITAYVDLGTTSITAPVTLYVNIT
jgi:hypothetical protein